MACTLSAIDTDRSSLQVRLLHKHILTSSNGRPKPACNMFDDGASTLVAAVQSILQSCTHRVQKLLCKLPSEDSLNQSIVHDRGQRRWTLVSDLRGRGCDTSFSLAAAISDMRPAWWARALSSLRSPTLRSG